MKAVVTALLFLTLCAYFISVTVHYFLFCDFGDSALFSTLCTCEEDHDSAYDLSALSPN